MDPKKQDLNPELKQIYDRVMNTQVSNKPATPPPSQPQASAQPAPAQTVLQPTAQPSAPQPITAPKAFVFTGNKVITPQGESHLGTQATAPKKGLPGSIIGVLVVMLVIAWGALWAKILGLF